MFKLILTAACLLSLSARAQFTVSGNVRDNEKKEPLAGAVVLLGANGKMTSTDAIGAFTISDVAPGSYMLKVQMLGYATQTQTINVSSNQELSIVMSESVIVSEEAIVSALRAGTNTPTTFTNVSQEDLAKQNYGQDLPLLLNWTPSLVTTSDAGAGVGYTGLRIRGSDASHINVTINGIPYNDSESQSVYWVDVPDVASSTQSVQVQRGVGTSTNGAGAFGGSVNVQTTSLQAEPYAEVSNSYGSFNTHKHTLRAGTGLINGVWAFDGRVSKINSDGYIERASADLGSYYLSGGYYGKKTLVKAIVFGGSEVTYQSWYGIDPAMMKINRRFNYAGVIYNDDGTVKSYYDRQVDDYKQDHYQLHFAHQLNSFWNVNAALHYTYGRGYFEEYVQGQQFSNLGLQNIVLGDSTISSGDFVTRQWLDNRFYGTTYSIHHSKNRIDFTAGGAFNRYGNAKHYGEIIWAQYAGTVPLRAHYYDALSAKNDFNVFAKLNFDFTRKLNGFLDFQYRRVTYKSSGLDDDRNPYNIDDNFNFFNPKAGLTYSISETGALYASYAVAHREPTRADYLGGIEKPKSEQLGNLEAGWKQKSAKYSLEANYYLMQYHNQLVLTGALNSTGYPIRANVGRSYRTGIEISGSVKISDRIMWGANVTLSRNKNKEVIVVDDSGLVIPYKNTNLILSPEILAGSQLGWTPLRGVQLTLLSKYVGKQYLDNRQVESVKLNAYFTNDIRLAWTIQPKFVKEIELGVLFNNVLNTMYSSNGAVYSGTPYYYPQAGRNWMGRVAVRF